MGDEGLGKSSGGRRAGCLFLGRIVRGNRPSLRRQTSWDKALRGPRFATLAARASLAPTRHSAILEASLDLLRDYQAIGCSGRGPGRHGRLLNAQNRTRSRATALFDLGPSVRPVSTRPRTRDQSAADVRLRAMLGAAGRALRSLAIDAVAPCQSYLVSGIC